MLTDHQYARLAEFRDAIWAGKTDFPENVLWEIADLLDTILRDDMQAMVTPKEDCTQS